ncbi:MAG: universal stress protein, partial [Candidatus Limnocylindria bacterium]
NLTALRELALRIVAQRVEGQLEDTIAGQQLPLVTERVVVLVDGSPASRRAVRRAAKLAGVIHGALIAVVIETPEADRQPFDRNRDLQEVIGDATDLGATIIRAEAKDLASGLEEIARSHRATHLVLPHRATVGLRRLFEGPLIDRLVDRLPDVELHVVGAPGRA